MGRFDERASVPARGPKEILRWKLLDPLRGRGAPKDRTGFETPRVDGGPALLARPSITWIGHASFVFRLGGQLVATDPIFSTRISGVVKRLVAPGIALEALPPLDVVTVSHNHLDHLDLPTIKRLGAGPTYVAPIGHERWLRGAGAEKIVELDWWQSTKIGGLEITLVPARHWSMRAPWNRNDALWGGFVYRGAEGAGYHSGDTAYFDGFAEIGRRLGPIDWAMLPIGSYEPRWFMHSQHMNPDDALKAFVDLRARTFVAMHWGTFRLTDEPMGEPAEKIQRLFADARLDPQRLWLMAVGENRAFTAR